MKRAIIAPIAFVSLLAAPAAGPAQPLWFDLTVPGSIEEMLGTPNRSLEGPHLLRRLIDVFHDPTGTIANPEQAAGAFRDCLGDVQRLRDRWRAVEQAVGEVSLSAAAYADGRPALERFLELFGLRLTGGDDPRVAPNREDGRRREAEETADEERRAVCGVGDGWSSARIERRLNAGETIVWDVPHFEVSLPLSPRVWLQVLYGDDIAAGAAEQAAERAADLVGRLVTNSRAARFYAGLAALDDATLAWFQANPRLLARLADEHLTAFAQYGAGLRVRDGAVRGARRRRLLGGPRRRPRHRARTVRGPPVRLGTGRERLRPGGAAARGVAAVRDRRRAARCPRLAPRPGPARAGHGDAAAAGPPVRRTRRRAGPQSGVHAATRVQARRPSEREHLQPAGRRGDDHHVVPSRGPLPISTARVVSVRTSYVHHRGTNEMSAIEFVYGRGEPVYACRVETRLYSQRIGSWVPMLQFDGVIMAGIPSLQWTAICTGSATR